MEFHHALLRLEASGALAKLMEGKDALEKPRTSWAPTGRQRSRDW